MKSLLVSLALCVLATFALSTRLQSQATMAMAMGMTVAPDDALTWVKTEDVSNVPNARSGHSSVTFGDQILVFGGCYPEQKCFDDLLSYNIKTKFWETISTIGYKPSARQGHSATLVGKKMYVFGGNDLNKYYNDLHIYDVETKSWEQASFEGNSPSPRSNHGAILDYDGNIIIFGGFAESSYSNELFYLDPIGEKWAKPVIAGKAPSARESFTITRVHKLFYIFGGFTDGGVLNDIIALDQTAEEWKTVETQGVKPPARQGHGAVLYEKNMIIFGGCDYKANQCYKDTYYLDTSTLYWTKLTEAKSANMNPAEQFSYNDIGGSIYVFGGCQMYSTCYNDMTTFNTGVNCPNSCSEHGTCENERCSCKQGFISNDCSMPVVCPDDCNNHGICHTDQTCDCYNGYTGSTCAQVISCPGNCTDTTHGTCQNNGTCTCNPGFSGESCSEGSALALTCPNSCSNHGTCDTNTGKCSCQGEYTGEDCSEEVKQQSSDDNTTAGTTTTDNNTNKDTTTSNENKTNKNTTTTTNNNNNNSNSNNSSNNKNTNSNNNSNSNNTSNDNSEDKETNTDSNSGSQTSVSSNRNRRNTNTNTQASTSTEDNTETEVEAEESSKNGTLTPEMFGETYRTEAKKAKRDSENSDVVKLDSLEECPNECSFNGICKEGKCYCQTGYMGQDCSESDVNHYKSGEPFSEVIKFGGICFGIGLIIGIFLIITVIRKSEAAENRQIEDDESDED